MNVTRMIILAGLITTMGLRTCVSQEWYQSVSQDPEARAVALKGIELMVQLGKSESQAQQQMHALFANETELELTRSVVRERFPAENASKPSEAFVETYVRVGLQNAGPQKRDTMLRVLDGIIQETESLSTPQAEDACNELRGQYHQLLHDTAEIKTERRGDVHFEHRTGAFGYEHCQWNYVSAVAGVGEIPESQVTVTKYPGAEPIGKVQFALELEHRPKTKGNFASPASYQAPNVCEYELGQQTVSAPLKAPKIIEHGSRCIAVYEEELFPETPGVDGKDLFTFAACLQEGGKLRLRYRVNGKILPSRIVNREPLKVTRVLKKAKEWMAVHWSNFIAKRRERISNSKIRSFLANRPARSRFIEIRKGLTNRIRENAVALVPRRRISEMAPPAPEHDEPAQAETPTISPELENIQPLPLQIPDPQGTTESEVLESTLEADSNARKDDGQSNTKPLQKNDRSRRHRFTLRVSS